MVTPDEIQEQLAHFRARTEQYLGLGHDRFEAARFVAEAVEPLEGRVLDVGTGKGLLAMALARRGLEVVSVDVNPEDQDFAAYLVEKEGLSDRVRFVLSDAASLPFPDGHFSTCAMMDVLHHLDDGAAVLGEMTRVLKPGGYIVAADFSAAGFDLVARVHAAEGREHPQGSATMAWADTFLEKAGLERTVRAEGELHDLGLYRKPRMETARCPRDV